MSFSGENINLLTKKFIIVRDGIFDDFFNSTVTSNQFTANSANSGSTYSQAPTQLYIQAGGTATSALYYQNQNAFAPNKGLPFPSYVDIILETRLKITNYVNLAGFAVSHGDENFTASSSRQFSVGLYYAGAASANNGVYIIEPDGSTTLYNTFDITLGTEYNLVVQINYDVYQENNWHLITINAWINGTKYIDDHTVARTDLYGYRLDGVVGIYTSLPTTAGSGGDVYYYYYSCNRIEKILDAKYTKSLMYTIGDIELLVGEINFVDRTGIGLDSIIRVYARENVVTPEYMDPQTDSIDPFRNSTLDTNLIMRHDFNGTLKDKSGNGYNASFEGGATYTAYGSQLIADLDGTNDYIDLPDINIDWATNGFTISFWVNFESTDSNERVFVFETSPNSVVSAIRCYRDTTTNDLVFTAYNSSAVLILGAIADNTIINNQWMFIAITVTSNPKISIYKNTESVTLSSVTETSMPPTVNRDENYIGWSGSTTYSQLQIRNFWVWNRVLTPAEISKCYEYGFYKLSDLADNLIMKFNFDGDANDETDRYNGTLMGNASASLDHRGYRKVLDLDGTGDYVDLPDIDIDWSTKGWTVAFWAIMDTAPTANNNIFFADDSIADLNNQIAIYCQYPSPKLAMGIYDAAGTLIRSILTTSNPFTVGMPVHIIITEDPAGTVVVYQNNSSISLVTNTGTGLPPTILRNTHHIGLNYVGGSYYWFGQIWDFCIWNRVISSEERERVYESNRFKHRWTGIIIDIVTNNSGTYKIIGKHYTSILDKRLINTQGNVTDNKYNNKTASYIIADNTEGIIALNGTGFTDTNVQSTSMAITKEYIQTSIRDILLELSAIQDHFVWLDEDLDIHFESSYITDTMYFYEEGKRILKDYDINEISSENYGKIIVIGNNIKIEVVNPNSVHTQGGIQETYIVDYLITNTRDAFMKAMELFLLTRKILVGTIWGQQNYFLDIGKGIQLKVYDNGLQINSRKFIISEIEESLFESTQKIVLTEMSSNSSDYLYSIYKRSNKSDNRHYDKTLSSVGNKHQISYTTIEYWFDYLCEWSSDGITWSEWDSGHATACGRSLAVLTACFPNTAISSNVSEGTFQGYLTKIGSGKRLSLFSDTDLEIPHVTTQQIYSRTVTTTDPHNIAFTATWDNSAANGTSISESGFYSVRSAFGGCAISNTEAAYGTHGDYAPYNVATQLFCRCVFPPFSKTANNYFRITFTCYTETINKRE